MHKPLDIAKPADFVLFALLSHAREDLSFSRQLAFPTTKAAYSFRHHFYAFRSALLRSNNSALAQVLQDFTLSLSGSVVTIENAGKLLPFYAGLISSNKPATIPSGEALIAEGQELHRSALLHQADFLLRSAQEVSARTTKDPDAPHAIMSEMHKLSVSTEHKLSEPGEDIADDTISALYGTNSALYGTKP